MLIVAVLGGAGFAVVGCNQVTSIGTVNDNLGSGINLGQALEAPREGDWGFSLEADYFAEIADTGFGHVRVPMNWAAYADTAAPYEIPDGNDPTVTHPDYDNIWERVDWVLDQADEHDLMVILNVHHYEELHIEPLAHQDRFEAIWQQIAERYAEAGDHVVFELLNEPSAEFTEDPDLWNDIFAGALAVVRESNPTRPVVVGPVAFNSVDALDDLVLPDDSHLITSIHFYEPFDFTHQGAPWIENPGPAGAEWDPQELSFGPTWNDFSWSNTRTSATDALVVDFDEQWAGLNFNRSETFRPETMTLEVSGEGALQVVCDVAEGEGDDELVEVITSTSVATAFELDLQDCPATTTGIFIQFASPEPAQMRFMSGAVCTETVCDSLFGTAAEALQARLGEAQAWGEANNRPINLGEFGAYGADGSAPLASRAEWTSTVRQAAANAGMSTTYWEFGGGFGAYDPEDESWIPPLRDALTE